MQPAASLDTLRLAKYTGATVKTNEFDGAELSKTGTHHRTGIRVMLTMLIGLALFFLIHLVPTQVELRDGLVRRFGERSYKLAFTAVSLVGLVLIVLGYGKLQAMPGKNPVLWYPPLWTRHLAFTLMLPAFILLAAAYVPSRIRTAARHPMLAAVKIWALAHLLANGDLGSIVLFGSFLAWAVFDRISVKKRAALGPLGSTQPASALNDVVVVIVGTALYAAMLVWGHRALIGVPLLGS